MIMELFIMKCELKRSGLEPGLWLYHRVCVGIVKFWPYVVLDTGPEDKGGSGESKEMSALRVEW